MIVEWADAYSRRMASLTSDQMPRIRADQRARSRAVLFLNCLWRGLSPLCSGVPRRGSCALEIAFR